MDIRVYSAEQQGVGAFDGGRFLEQRPIGFPREPGAVPRVGPLFYWAWGYAEEEAEIGLHPHKAFEILTYVLRGTVEHQDSLGTRQTVTAGGAQVMQAGSGIYHGEAFRGPQAEAMQIWFEPDLDRTVQQAPTYRQYDHDQFPLVERDGVVSKTVVGAGAPVRVDTDAQLYDWTLAPGSVHAHELAAGRQLALLAIDGSGTVNGQEPLARKAFAVAQVDGAGPAGRLTLHAAADSGLRVIAIEVPSKVDYPLYRK
ncbi:pirin family protein [Paenibacillus athensensis]|uniref:Pirin n=1 Tax=Paenibacillus athensensis TaxID=1967502 RepID=A0A4Y8Q9G2_9BACL|nr:pirin family protein [Paenibacillus athensensis]MCD1260070.1 pirin family protein [Paenibacillus athensensis]